MGLLSRLFKTESEKDKLEIQFEEGSIYAPVRGTIIRLEELEDGVFSEGVLGQGCGIIPEEEVIKAPISGTVSTVAESLHAVGITGDNGAELLIHVGVDTVMMNGKGFEVFAAEGEHVSCGQELLTFSKAAIKHAGYKDTVIVVVTNSSEYHNTEICASGNIGSMEKVIQLKK